MNILVWGIGALWEQYKEYLLQFHIIKLCDSDVRKQGTCIDTIEIIPPNEIAKYEYDYIVIMTYATSEIYQKLINMYVPVNKILTYNQIFLLQNQTISIQSNGKEIIFDKWRKKNSRAVLLLSQDFSYTGVPVALKNMALLIREMGYSVLLAAERGGNFVAELRMLGLDYLEKVNLCYGTECFKEMLSHFTVIIAGSFALNRIVETWNEINVPILWWIHETDKVFYDRKIVLPQNKNILYLAGGNRVKRMFEMYYPNIKMRVLQYCIPDTKREYSENDKREITVSAIGSIVYRKAQDVLLEAIEMLPNKYKHKFRFIIIGKMPCHDKDYIDLIKKEMSKISNLEWIEELAQAEMDLYYDKIDVLVCASRDDPMPIVVTQAMMHEKTCIVSNEVGQAEFIIPEDNGLIFKSEDRQALKEALMWVADHSTQLTIIGQSARKIYDSEFSEEIMKEKLCVIFKEILHKDN